MPTQRRLQTLLQALADEFGLPSALEPDEAGNYCLSFDFRLNVRFIHLNENAALMIAKCGRANGLDDLRREQLFRSCLNLSLARMAESSAVITVDAKSGAQDLDLVLYQFLELQSINAEDFQSQVESFVGELNLWMQFISEKLRVFEPQINRNDEVVIAP